MSKAKSDLARVVNLGVTPTKQLTLKFLIMGGYGVGKSSVVARYLDEKFIFAHWSTIGIDFHRKFVRWSAQYHLQIQLWDLAGSEKFKCVTSPYYRNSHGVVLVIDVTQPQSLDKARDWLDEVRKNTCNADGTELPVVLTANKSDLKNAQITEMEIVSFCEKMRIQAWCYTSALLNNNIDKAFNYLIEHAVKKWSVNEKLSQLSSDSIKLDYNTVKRKENHCCRKG